jgi:ribulose bisphosphate carboxylase small subunit
MQAIHAQAAVLNLPAIAEIARLIEENLTHDWILRVEHSSSESIKPMCRQWEQWGDSMFAVTDPALVIDNIVACRASHPDHSIRLNAEKVRPRSQLYYWVYTSGQHAMNAPLIEHDPVNTPVRINNWLSRLGDSAVAARSRLWRILALIGMLFASVLMIEEVMA